MAAPAAAQDDAPQTLLSCGVYGDASPDGAWLGDVHVFAWNDQGTKPIEVSDRQAFFQGEQFELFQSDLSSPPGARSLAFVSTQVSENAFLFTAESADAQATSDADDELIGFGGLVINPEPTYFLRCAIQRGEVRSAFESLSTEDTQP